LELVEQRGLIGPLALCVLDQALAQQARWTREGVDLSVAVNLSAANLRDEELPAKIAALLARHGVDPDRLILEITEDSLMGDPDECLQLLDQLRSLGAGLSIDDYGTGFSSLAYLRDLNVDELKLDRTFLTHVSDDPRSMAIVRSTVELAHALGLRAVAEGIETKEILELVADLGFDVAQGYYLGRPAPAEELFCPVALPPLEAAGVAVRSFR
jgi:EAL domain-containing protein (putative c-di-GMP-specific phosphodiesterase class I)